MFHQLVFWLVSTVGQWGYIGIVLLMALESSFFPFPSEVVIPPAAYLAATGKMNIGMVVFCGTLGSLFGAVFNYWLAMKFGRPFFQTPRPYQHLHRPVAAGHPAVHIPSCRACQDEFPYVLFINRPRRGNMGYCSGRCGLLVRPQRGTGIAKLALDHSCHGFCMFRHDCHLLAKMEQTFEG